MSHLAQVPEEPGDTVEVGDWQFTVLSLDGRRITEVEIRRVGVDQDRSDGDELS
jgi:CBS domain containing-hemolysin-like protein